LLLIDTNLSRDRLRAGDSLGRRVLVETTQPKNPLDFEASLVEARQRLTRLERWEWWRWVTVIIVSLALTAGLFALSYPGLRTNVAELETMLRALLGMVLLFDVFAFYQQFKITRMRRELSNQIGMLSTLEALRPPSLQEQVQRQNRRRFARYFLDKRIQIMLGEGRSAKIIYGRTRDISEGGVGVVLPDSIDPETQVEIELPVDFQPTPMRLRAVVCFRRGFSHGMEWSSPDPADMASIRRICSSCKPVSVP
jgi:hypothetical protein